MIVDNGGTSFDYPQGDPGAIDAAAGQLRSVAGNISTAASQVGATAQGALGTWVGPASQSFELGAQSVKAGLSALAGYHNSAASALSTYATALTNAQNKANQAGQGYETAERSFQNGMANLQANPPTGSNAQSQLASQQSTLSTSLNNAYSQASNTASQACTDATTAAVTCASTIDGIAAEIKANALSKFLDLIAGPGALLGVFGVEQQFQSAAKLWGTLAIRNADAADAIGAMEESDMNPFMVVYQLNKFFTAHPPDQASEAFEEFLDEAVPIDQTASDASRAAQFLDVFGKASLVFGVVADGLTIADPQSSWTDRGMSIANLGGIGMVAAGTDAGGTLLAVAGIDSVAAAIPIAGEVVIAGTALFMAGEFVYQNWGAISHGVDDAYNWANGEVNSAVNWGTGVASSAYHSASHLVDSGLHDASHIISDLNPF